MSFQRSPVLSPKQSQGNKRRPAILDIASDLSQIPNLNSLTMSLDSVKNTLEFGKRLGHTLKGGDVLALTGDLGAGKTLITRGIALGLGITAEQVTSPTFTLIQTYKGRIPVIHVDLYRLEDPSAILQLGLEDYFTPENIVIIEWADRLLQILPPDYLALHLEHSDTETVRHLTIRGTGPRSTDVVRSLSHSNMVDHSSTNRSIKD
jgi:tRNA threonylcarbamoyladenosine biosynthesis protein TsaE